MRVIRNSYLLASVSLSVNPQAAMAGEYRWGRRGGWGTEGFTFAAVKADVMGRTAAREMRFAFGTARHSSSA